MDDDFFNYLVATDEVDGFLGYKIQEEVKDELVLIAEDYKNDLIDIVEVESLLKELAKKYKIGYEVLVDYFNEQFNVK